MMNMRSWGILFLVGAVGFAVAGFVLPGALIVFVVGAVVFALVGAVLIWMHTFMKGVPKVAVRSGLERMANGAAVAAQRWQDLTGQGVGDEHDSSDDRPVSRDEPVEKRPVG